MTDAQAVRDGAEFMAKAMTEKQLLASVRELAGVFGWLCYHTHRSDRSEAGFPDLVMVRGETMVVMELKSKVGKVTLDQRAWLDAMRRVPGVIYCDTIRPRDWLNGFVEALLR